MNTTRNVAALVLALAVVAACKKKPEVVPTPVAPPTPVVQPKVNTDSINAKTRAATPPASPPPRPRSAR
jgi:hypothetical protein